MEVVTKRSAVGYVRCSTEMQEDSPDQQKKEIVQFAEKHGYSVVDWFIDFGKSGTTFNERPAFERLRKVVENGRTFNTVICYDESRWGRAIDSEENTYWRFHFRKLGVEVLLVKTSIDPHHEFAPMLKAFEGVQASQYSKKLSELTVRGAKNNGKYSSGGSAPYGFKRVAINQKTGAEKELAQGEWCVKGQEKVRWALGDQAEVDVVRLIFDRRSAMRSQMLIATELNNKGVPCPKRGRWRNKDQKWSPGTIKSILENPVYYGVRTYNKNSMSKIIASQRGRTKLNGVTYPHWRNDPSEWVTEENAHEPIVTKEVWDKANSIRPELRTKCRPKYDVPYLLTGLITCSRCGFPFQGQSKLARGKRYYKYVCGGYNGKRVCSYCSIDRNEIERFVIEAVKETISSPGLVELIEQKVETLLRSRSSIDKVDLQTLDQSIRSREQAARNLGEAIAAHGPIPTLIGQLEDAEKDLGRLKDQKGKFTSGRTCDISPQVIRQRVAEFILCFEEKNTAVPTYEKKELIKRVVSRIVVDREAGVARCYVRRVPAVTSDIQNLYAQIEKNETPHKEALRNKPVAGTGLEPATFGL